MQQLVSRYASASDRKDRLCPSQAPAAKVDENILFFTKTKQHVPSQ